LETFSAGTLAGAGCFRCGTCGYAIALHERDEVPDCPHCGNNEFKRSSIFMEAHRTEPTGDLPVETPDWLDEAREALVSRGTYVAYEDDERVRVVPLQEGWTRLGRSLAAHVRFDDPTVSRRHALVHCQDADARVLDDRSLNGVFLNGEKVEWAELSDGDEISIGRFKLYFIALESDQAAESDDAHVAIA
jgi:predicted  nucleic acid-binding Zn-ribbon protein